MTGYSKLNVFDRRFAQLKAQCQRDPALEFVSKARAGEAGESYESQR